MNALGHQVGQRLVNEPVPCDGIFSGEYRGYDHELEMPTAFLGALVTGVLAAVVEYFQRLRSEGGQPLAH